MIQDAYITTFKKAYDDFIEAQLELGEINKRKAELETRIAHLHKAAEALARMCGEDFDQSDALGLTDASRQAFLASPGTEMTAQVVYDRLEGLGFNLTKYGNALDSIHTGLTRLEEKGEIEEIGTVEGKTAYMRTRLYANSESELAPR